MTLNLFQQYGGFYKHQVESALNAPERLFLLMGYASSGQQSLILDGPVELDKVTVVARDCLLAYVECQVRTVTINQSHKELLKTHSSRFLDHCHNSPRSHCPVSVPMG